MALIFNGTTDYIDYGDINVLDTPSQMTVSFWHKQEAGAAAADAFVSKKSGSVGFLIDALSTKDSMTFCTGDIANSATSPTGQTTSWAHWLFVYDGAGATNSDRLKMYKNGVAETPTYTGTMTATNLVDSTTTHVLVGQEVGVNFAAMSMANLRIWTAALSPAEALMEYTAFVPQSHYSSLILWTLLEPNNTVDYSGSGNNGTATGTTNVAAGSPPGMAFPDTAMLSRNVRRAGLGNTFLSTGGRRNSFRRLGPFVNGMQKGQ